MHAARLVLGLLSTVYDTPWVNVTKNDRLQLPTIDRDVLSVVISICLPGYLSIEVMMSPARIVCLLATALAHAVGCCG
jgi:hypothetical protein